MRRLLILLVVSACSIPSPEAPSWEVTANVPMVARTVFVRDLIGSEGDFFFGAYGPYRLMDTDSVVASVTSNVIVTESFSLHTLPAEGDTTIAAGTAAWSGNPVDELDNPSFYRGWLEIIIQHNLPGRFSVRMVLEGWDDNRHPSDPIEAEVAVEPSADGSETTATYLLTNDDILAFINPSATHAVPDSYAVTGTLTYSGLGQPVGPDPTLSIQVSLMTAFDLTFDGADVDRRSIVQKLIIDPANSDTEDADVEGDLTENLREARIVADVLNNLPVGGQAFVRVDHDSLRLWDEPELLVGPFDFDSPPLDPVTGKSTGTTAAQSTVILDQDQMHLFANPGPGNDTLYAAVEYLLDGTGTRRVCVCADDSLRAEVLMGITSLVEPDDE